MLKKISIGLATLGAMAAGAYALFIRPWHLHWGATAEEVHRPLPGDMWIPHPKMESTHVITIQAQPADIWPWLVQMGTGRAGRYSYDWLENLLPRSARGSGITNAVRIIPEFQDLKVGGSIPFSPTTGLTVAEIDPPSVLALRVTMSPLTGMPFDPYEPKPDAYFDGSWVFVLEELDEQTTRVIERVRADYQPHLWLAPLVYLFLEPATFVMERKMLLGIKQRAKRVSKQEPEHQCHSSVRSALIGVKTLHSLIYFSIEFCMAYLIYAGLTGREDRRTAVAAGVVAGESIIFLGNRCRCPLTRVAEDLGAAHGSVTDIYLPRWLASNIFPLHVPLLALALCLHARNFLRRSR